MGYKPRRTVDQLCWHDPVPVYTLITEELVAHVCSKCYKTCTPRPVAP